MADIHWTGLGTSPLDNNYRDGGNWSGGYVPSAADDVKLGGSGYKVNLSPGKVDDFYVNSLQINKGVTLLVHDANGQFTPHDTSLHVLGQIDNRGTIQLAGGSVRGGYTDTAKSVITGYGNLFLNGDIDGKVVATQQGTGILSLTGGVLRGKLAGDGMAELSNGFQVGDGAQVSVAHILFSDAGVSTDLNLSHSSLTVGIGGLNVSTGHALTINGATINGGTLGGGTIINNGEVTINDGGALGYGEFTNNGHINVLAGHYNTGLYGELSGSGSVTLQDGATIHDGVNGSGVSGRVDAEVTLEFTTNGKLLFDSNAYDNFHGSLSGFGGSNTLEFDYSGFSQYDREPNLSLNYTADDSGHSGTLTMTDGIDTFAVHLLGDYTASGFEASYDDHAALHLSYQTPTSVSDSLSSGSLIHI